MYVTKTYVKDKALISLTSPCSVDMKQIQQIMKEFGTENYKNNLDKQTFGDVMDRLGLLEQASRSGLDRQDLVEIFFDMFDEDKDGEVSFFEFVHGVSVLLKGSLEEKAQSSFFQSSISYHLLNSLLLVFFRMYDHNHDGKITRYVTLRNSVLK